MTINACFARMVAHTEYIYYIFLWIYQIKASRPICRDRCTLQNAPVPAVNFRTHFGTIYKAYLVSGMCL